jgi:predicted RNA-binding Zn ribbon-like protein
VTKQGKYLDTGFTAQSPWLDLVNSQQWDGFGRLSDHLRKPSWLAKFVRYWKFRPGNGRAPGYKELAGLRDALRPMAERIASARRLRTQELRVLNLTLKVAVYQQVAKRNQDLCLELTPLRFDWAWIRSQIVVSFIETIVRRRGNRIKICPNSGCRWVFYDSTKGNVRRWCNDRTCGNRDRVRRARARHK